MSEAYISSTPKSWIKEWFNNGSWSHEDTTSVIIRRDNGKLIQVFGAGKEGEYDYMKKGELRLYNCQTGRSIGRGTFLGYANDLVKCAATFVFK